MTDETHIQANRKARLRELIDTFFGGRIVDLASLINKESSYVGRMLYPVDKKQSRPVSDKYVRIITTAVNLPPSWFDQPAGGNERNLTTNMVSSNTASYGSRPVDPAHRPAATTIVWPFRLVGYQRLLALQDALGTRRGADAIREIDSYLDAMVSRWEKEARQTLRTRAA